MGQIARKRLNGKSIIFINFYKKEKSGKILNIYSFFIFLILSTEIVITALRYNLALYLE